ncbi:MAG: choice-of-anchor tandem repeat NxxGxxAF-containing protein [Terriglobia bacterium]
MTGLWNRPTRTCVATAFALSVALIAGQQGLRAQSNTRLLLASGWGVPGHPGFAFGPFSNLAMNKQGEIVFATSLRGAKSELRAIVRSSGVTFSVVAFAGLRSPVPKAIYESFSAPSISDSGAIAFTATLKDDVPASAVFRVQGDSTVAIASSGGAVPGIPDVTFQEFSAPVISSAGNVLFGARLAGKQPSTRLFLWTPKGLSVVPLTPELVLKPNDLLVPAFASHDEAVFIPRGTPVDAVNEQFFRALAIGSFQDLRPPPEANESVEMLAARTGSEPPIKMLVVMMEGESVRAALLPGEPAAPVLARRPAGPMALPLGRILAQTAGPRGNIIFAAAPAGQPNDLALYCYCENQVNRLTSPEEFLPITGAALGRPITSLAGDASQTMALIAPNDPTGDATAIYVVSIP